MAENAKVEAAIDRLEKSMEGGLRGKTECPCCAAKVKPCPFCGSPGMIYGSNLVGCSENVQCGGEVDFGHWVGETDDGVPAVHFVVEQWNKRVIDGPGPLLVTEDEVATLKEMAAYPESYPFRQKMCGRLVDLGFAERTRDDLRRSPHRITGKGRAFLAAQRRDPNT